MDTSSKTETYNRREVAQILSKELGRYINIDKIKNLEKSQLVTEAHDREKGGRYDAMKYTREDIDELALYFDLKESGFKLDELKEYKEYSSDQERYDLLLHKYIDKQIDQLKTAYSIKRIGGYLNDFENDLNIKENGIYNYKFEALEYTTSISMHTCTHTLKPVDFFLEIEDLAIALVNKINTKVEKEKGIKNYFDDYQLKFYAKSSLFKKPGNVDLKHEGELLLDLIEKIGKVRWKGNTDISKEEFNLKQVQTVCDFTKKIIKDLFYNDDYTFKHIEISTLFDMVDTFFKKNKFISNIMQEVNPDFEPSARYKGIYVYLYSCASLKAYLEEEVIKHYNTLESSGKFELKPLMFISVGLADIGCKNNIVSKPTKFSINTKDEILLTENEYRLHYALTREVSFEYLVRNIDAIIKNTYAVIDKFKLKETNNMIYEFHKYAGESSVNIQSYKLWIPIEYKK